MSRSEGKSLARAGAILSVLGLILLASFVGPWVNRADAALRPLKTGVSYVYVGDPVEFEQVKRAGARWVLTPLKWWDVSPRKKPASWNPEDPGDPHYDWREPDQWVANAVAAGLTPILQVRGAPTWGQNCPNPYPFDAPCKPDPAGLAAFSKAAAIRYGGSYGGLPRVQYWQGLNEPNLSLFFNPQFEGGKAVSPTLYRTLINTFYKTIKAVDPSNVVIAGGLGPIAVPGYTIGPMKFTRELLCMTGHKNPQPTRGNCSGGVYFDIFDIHPYTTGGPTHEGGVNDVQMGDLAKLQELLRAADRAGRIKGNKFKRTPLWITELSWDTNPPDPGGLPMKIASQWAAESLYRSWLAGVSHFFWFSLVDFDPEPTVPSHESLETGLYFWAPEKVDRQPKETLFAFRFPFVAFPRDEGLFVWGRTPTGAGGKVAIQIQRGSEWHDLAVLNAGANGMFSKTLKSGYGRNKKGNVRAAYLEEASVPFPMRPVGDFPQAPFGNPVG